MTSPIIEAKVWRCDYTGNRLEDVSDIIMSGKATANPENDQTWQFDATVSWKDYQTRLTPYYDWLAPEMTVTWPDGRVRQGQLGLYFLVESPVRHEETRGTVQLRAMDPLWLVARQQLSNKLIAREGDQKDRTLRGLLDAAIFTDDEQGRRRFAIPSIPNTKGNQFKRAKEWPRSTNRLDICNEVAQGMGCYNLWTSPTGIITTKRMKETKLRNRTPVRTYSAHLPDTIILTEDQLPYGGLESEVVGAIDTSPFDDSLLNEILICNDLPDGSPLHVRGKIRNHKNPRSVFRNKRGRRHVRKIRNPVLDDTDTAQEVAEALLESLSTKNRTAQLTVLPDPEADFLREVVDCFIWNEAGDEIAFGRYAVHQISYNFRPAENAATMVLDIGRIDDIDDGTEDTDDE